MKIYIDSTSIVKNRTGIGYYTYNLIKEIQKLSNNNEYYLIIWILFFRKKVRPVKIKKHNFHYKYITFFPFKIYNKFFKWGIYLPLNIFMSKPDIVFFPNFIRYPVFKTKTITVIYDLSYIKFPEYGEAKNVKFLTKNVLNSIKKSSHIITISKSAKQEIIDYYNVPGDKISIVYPSYNQDLFKYEKITESMIKKVKEKYNIKNKYILFTSTLEPRKNILGIINSYKNLDKKIRDEYSLVLAGGKGWRDEEIIGTIEKAKKDKLDIIQTGYVAEEDLQTLYSFSNLFLYPSFYEGFGMPILEAMACGAPVITSNTSSMPEVAGDAAILVDPNNTEEIKAAIEKVLTNESLKKEMIEKGYKQVKKFSWEKSAKKLLDIFEEVGRE